MNPLIQYQFEMQKQLRAWNAKSLLQKIYAGFYQRILAFIDAQIPGHIVEIGSGLGNFKTYLHKAITTDLFPNPRVDLVCDGYDLPFANETLSHLVLFDVFHHLCAPNFFLREARRVLTPRGRVILFEPYISWSSFPVYGLLHHEPVAWRKPINLTGEPTHSHDYYAAQGNATRLFFHREIAGWPESEGWGILHASSFSSSSYLLSGGYSKPAFYPASCLEALQRCDDFLSCWPRLFAARCLVVLQRS